MTTTSGQQHSSRRAQLAGRVISGLVIVFLSLDAVGKLLQPVQVVESTVALGYHASHIPLLGVLLSIGVLLYGIPRTALLGAIYLTGYLGGALASHFRIDSPLFTHVLFSVYVAVAVWLGLLLRRPALSRLLMGRRSNPM